MRKLTATEKYKNDLHNSAYGVAKQKLEYEKKHLGLCNDVKTVISGLLELLGCKDKLKHRKILKEITYYCCKSKLYVLIRYDQYGFIRINYDPFYYEFKASTGCEALKKIEEFNSGVEKTKYMEYRSFERFLLVKGFRERRKRDKDGFLI